MVKKRHRQWQAVAEEAQAYRDASLAKIQPPVPDVHVLSSGNIFKTLRSDLSPEEIDITESPAERLLEQLRAGQLTAVAVTNAFLRRAAIAQNLTNCITELLPERALARAAFLDDYLQRNGKPLGPLHGLPISVKEHIGMKGLGLNAGYVAWWNKTAPEDARVLQILSRAGAVFHARTTQPQTLMHLETDSNLYGVTVNPYNTHLSTGGSSGGEGALIGSRGSCLGIGTDIGGSIRNPAACNGIYGFKPTAFRIPTDGWSSTAAPGADPIATVIGPLSTSLEGIKLFMQTILSSQPWLYEPALIPMPWNNAYTIAPSQPLKIAIMWHDGIVLPHPPITRALRTIVTKLSTIPNITLVDWTPYLHDESWAIISSLYYPDAGAEEATTMAESGEPWRPLTEWMIKENPCVEKLTMKKLWYWLEEREAYRSEYAKVWNDTATATTKNANDDEEETGESLSGMVDAILCPVGPGVANKHNTAKYWGYTSQWNLLDYPAISFPVCKVDEQLDSRQQEVRDEFLGEQDRENWDLWDPSNLANMPVSLQLVGRRMEDEKIVAVLEYISKAIGLPFDEFP
ncbi:MAG: hypothetical protein Q9220_007394 [cf. Caloplaca sp. 1 TL-2023]